MNITVFLVLSCFTLSLLAHSYNVWLDKDTGKWVVKSVRSGLSVAEGTYVKNQNITGWDELRIVTNGTSPDEEQAYAAGYLEGQLTYDSIYLSWLSMFDSPFPDKLIDFAVNQDNWVRSMVKSQASTSPYWAQVGLTLQQFDGLVKGYADNAPKSQQLSYVQMLLFQLQAEIGDIMTYLQLLDGTRDMSSMEPPPIDSHCSVLVKLSSDGTRLMTSHDTWSSYTTMLRIYKFYQLNFNLSSNKSPFVAFSSYPNALQSSDDFYITSQNLAIAETTNDVMNNTLYLNYIKTETVPEWIRIIVANRMATSGKEWVSYFSQYNSGTYNNQWQIVDYKLFTPGAPLKPGTLWIAEQIPGYIVSDDKTDFLSKQGFWPSYNIPYFPEIYNLSNYPAYYAKYGNSYSYSECARAQIFRRDAPKVETLSDMKRIMRYNQYQTDKLSLQDACRSISARCDMNTPWSNNTLNGYSPFGAIDSKITDYIMASKLEALAVSGPSWDSQPPFAWNDEWPDYPHYGQPLIFSFYYVKMSPNFTGK